MENTACSDNGMRVAELGSVPAFGGGVRGSDLSPCRIGTTRGLGLQRTAGKAVFPGQGAQRRLLGAPWRPRSRHHRRRGSHNACVAPAPTPPAAAAPRWRRRSSRPWRVSAPGRGSGCSAWRPLPPRPRSSGPWARGGRGAEGGGRPGRNSRGAGGGGNSPGEPALRGGGLGTGTARQPRPLAREGARGGNSRGRRPDHRELELGWSPAKSRAGKEAPPVCTAGSGEVLGPNQ